MLTEHGNKLDLELIQRKNKIDDLPTAHPANAVDHIQITPQVGDVEEFIDALGRPRLVAQALFGDEDHAAAELFRHLQHNFALEGA